MSGVGRRKDPIWADFDPVSASGVDTKSSRAKCRNCKIEMVALLNRMNGHLSKCTGGTVTADSDLNDNDSEDPTTDSHYSTKCRMSKRAPDNNGLSDSEGDFDIFEDHARPSGASKQESPTPMQTNVKNKGCEVRKFVIRTTPADVKTLNLQLARFFFATNTPFRHVEHTEFVKLVQLLRPGYKPPNRHLLSGPLLNDVYGDVEEEMMMQLTGKTVRLSLDGWSNIHNEAIVFVSVNDVINESVFLIETFDTTDNKHSSEYLLTLAAEAIRKCSERNCRVRSLATDNAANMAKMRKELAKMDDIGSNDIITYDRSAHILNLFAHDIEDVTIKTDVKLVIKYFRNHPFPAAKYKQAKGKLLVLSIDVRWNTLADCLQSYVENWSILAQICTEHRAAISSEITAIVSNLDFKEKVQGYLKKLKAVAVALDKAQKDACTISEAAEIWLELLEEFESDVLNSSEEKRNSLQRRFQMAMTAPHYLANLLDPRFNGRRLKNEYVEKALTYVDSYIPSITGDIIKYRSNAYFFKEYLFKNKALEKTKAVTWWLSLKRDISEKTLETVMQLQTAIASSAGIERLFSTFGLVHSKLRNRLGVEKASKLVSVMKALNQK